MEPGSSETGSVPSVPVPCQDATSGVWYEHRDTLGRDRRWSCPVCGPLVLATLTCTLPRCRLGCAAAVRTPCRARSGASPAASPKALQGRGGGNGSCK